MNELLKKEAMANKQRMHNPQNRPENLAEREREKSEKAREERERSIAQRAEIMEAGAEGLDLAMEREKIHDEKVEHAKELQAKYALLKEQIDLEKSGVIEKSREERDEIAEEVAKPLLEESPE